MYIQSLRYITKYVQRLSRTPKYTDDLRKVRVRHQYMPSVSVLRIRTAYTDGVHVHYENVRILTFSPL